MASFILRSADLIVRPCETTSISMHRATTQFFSHVYIILNLLCIFLPFISNYTSNIPHVNKKAPIISEEGLIYSPVRVCDRRCPIASTRIGPSHPCRGAGRLARLTHTGRKPTVPSALWGLTAAFGMGMDKY